MLLKKLDASQSAFHDFVADQVDTTRNLERFNYTLDEFLAGAQLASFETSTNPVLTMTRTFTKTTSDQPTDLEGCLTWRAFLF